MSSTAGTENSEKSVSIIIPFLNNHNEVISIVKRIRNQNGELEPEIICVDNGSDDGHSFSEEFLKNQKVVLENNYLQSPYSARNRGIEHATGAVIVFVDANSRPANGWLKNGLRCLEESASDIVAGYVGFDFDDGPNAAQVADAITSINQKKSVENRKAAFTANLFVKRFVFESVGLFEEGVRSGGDVRWTKKATSSGHSIAFCGDAVVMKKARSFGALFKKRVRTGKGYLYTWLKEESDNVWFYNFLRALKPISPGTPGQLYHERFGQSLPVNRFRVWAVLYSMGVVEQVSFMAEYLRYNLGSGRDKSRQKELENNR
jgi:glycosyltransferase involved in cell wall biosynthesis